MTELLAWAVSATTTASAEVPAEQLAAVLLKAPVSVLSTEEVLSALSVKRDDFPILYLMIFGETKDILFGIDPSKKLTMTSAIDLSRFTSLRMTDKIRAMMFRAKRLLTV
jgi:hypothetical protein